MERMYCEMCNYVSLISVLPFLGFISHKILLIEVKIDLRYISYSCASNL